MGFGRFKFLFITAVLFAQTTLANPCATSLVVFPDRETGMGYRGFLGANPSLTPEALSKGEQLGIIWWEQRVFVKSSFEEARKHDQIAPRELMRGLYLIGDVDLATLPEEKVAHTFSTLLAGGMYWFENGELKKLDANQVQSAFVLDKLKVLLEPQYGYYFSQYGWMYPKLRGVLEFADTHEGQTYKKLRTFARSRLARGYKVTFNKDFPQAMQKLKNQVRSARIPTGERIAKKSENNRHDDTMIAAMLGRFQRGEAMTVEVWDPEGKLIGGLVAFITGSLYAPDSLFYDDLDYAKMAALALMDRLEAAGIPFLDTQDVTDVTRGLKGKFVSSQRFIEMWESLPKNVKPDFTTDWAGPVKNGP